MMTPEEYRDHVLANINRPRPPKQVAWRRAVDRLKGVGLTLWLAIGALLAIGSVGGGVVYAQTNGCDGHTVQRGDTLTRIAATHGTDVATLADTNSIANPDLIKAGDCITLKEGPPRVVYQDAVEALDGPQPGAVALMDAALDLDPAAHSDGIYNPRLKRGGSTWSLHAEGRAIDIGYEAHCDGPEGWLMTQALVAQHETLGIQLVFWCDVAWQVDRGWYTPSQGVIDLHQDHIHAELSWHWARTLTYDTAYAALLAELTPGTLDDVLVNETVEPEPVKPVEEPAAPRVDEAPEPVKPTSGADLEPRVNGNTVSPAAKTSSP